VIVIIRISVVGVSSAGIQIGGDNSIVSIRSINWDTVNHEAKNRGVRDSRSIGEARKANTILKGSHVIMIFSCCGSPVTSTWVER